MPDRYPTDEPGSEIPKARILVVDDETEIRESLDALLSLEGYSVEQAQNATEGLRRLENASYDLVLLDLMMPDRSGMEVLREVRERDSETPIFMITAYGSVEVAVDALKSGANDYFSKPWDNEKLLIEIDRMIARTRLERENTQLKRALKQRYSFPNIIGKSERMLRILDLVTQVAPSRATILITGETGTGKELIAKAVHANSARADQLFVPVNSGPRPSALFESALFGPFNAPFFTKYGRDNEKSLDSEGKSQLRFEPDAMQLLMDYNWPGNVRELENAVERAVVLASQTTVAVDVLPDSILQAGGVRIRRDESGTLPADASLFEIVADYERRKIIETLETVNWSQTDAAEKLSIPLSTLNQKIKRLTIDVRRKGGAAGS